MRVLWGSGWRYAALGALVLVAGLWWWRSGSSSAPPSQEARPPARSPWGGATRSDPGPSLAPISDEELPLPAPIPADGISDPASRAVAVKKLDETIRLYRETMTFPLWSRPADGSNAHLTRWNEPISTGQPFAADAAKREIRADAQIDRVFAGPGQPINVLVTASYVDDGSPAQLEQVDAELQWRDRRAAEKNDRDNEWVLIQPVPLRAKGKGSWIGAVVPSEVELLRGSNREVRIMAFVGIGEQARQLTLDFTYAAVQPVIVQGIASDRVVSGSLELGLGVELASAAPVALVATLFSADGKTPIAVYDDRYFPKRAGPQIIPMQFFGKILHDRGIDGPYRLGAIHGYVFRAGEVPDQAFFDRADSADLKTSPYAASTFSPAAFESPEVAARIAHYEAIREAMRAGREPPAPPPSAANPSR